MVDKPLHPNLARIAAEYDDVVLAFQQGRITPPEARRRILSLVARDDNGIEWSIDPDSGQWRFKTKWGHYEHGTPPAWGMASVTPADLGGGEKRTYEDRLHMHEIDLEMLVGSQDLAGRTIVQPKRKRPSVNLSVNGRLVAGVVLVLVTLAIVWIAVQS